MKEHHYKAVLKWTDVSGKGTTEYKAYNRNHSIKIEGKPTLIMSSDPEFMGDRSLHNPEDLFLSALASCHMLWYLHLCSVNAITVVDYTDQAEGTMIEKSIGGGHFKEVRLNPVVTILEKDKKELAIRLHQQASQKCYIANSCNFPITHKPTIHTDKNLS